MIFRGHLSGSGGMRPAQDGSADAPVHCHLEPAAKRSGAILRDERGATAIEMAFVAPVFLMLLFGIIHSGLLLFTKANLQYAVQRHVRCLAIQLSCPSPTTHYFALGSTPVFTPTQLTHCQALTGTVSYDFSVLMVQRTVALSATACFPRILDAAG